MLDYTKDNFPIISKGDKHDSRCSWSVCPDGYSVSAMLTTSLLFSQFLEVNNSTVTAVETEVNIKQKIQKTESSLLLVLSVNFLLPQQNIQD